MSENKRTNSPEVIERANSNRRKRMAREGRVYARPVLECDPAHRDEIRNAGLEEMKKVRKRLEGE